MGTSFRAAECRAPKRERLSQVLTKAYAAKLVWVSPSSAFSFVGKTTIFISKAQLPQNNTETVHQGFEKVSLELLTARLVPKENTVLGTLDCNPYRTGLLTFIKTSKYPSAFPGLIGV